MGALVPKEYRRKAEVAAEHLLLLLMKERMVEYGFTKAHLTRVLSNRAMRTQYAKVDFFGADVVVKGISTWYAQVTTGQYASTSTRRKKLEVPYWLHGERVLLLWFRHLKDIAESKVKISYSREKDDSKYAFETQELEHGEWKTLGLAYIVPKSWFVSKGMRERLGLPPPATSL